MIGYLRGLVIERRSLGETSAELVVDTGGVGYRVLVPTDLAIAATPGDGEIALHVHTHVRESAITLYGFADPLARQCFELLLGAHGVGPSLALSLCSVYGPARLGEIVAGGDTDALTLVPGVGKKTAARLILELKPSFDQLEVPLSIGTGALGAKSHSAMTEVSEALSQLGYASEEVRSVLRSLPTDESTEELLRLALRELAPRR